MNFIDFLKQEIKNKQQENRKELFKNSNLKALLKKISLYKEKYHDDREINIILDEITRSVYLQNILSKDPMKQNICEKSQIKYILNKNINITKQIKPLYINNGEFTNSKPATSNIKSIDAIIVMNNKKYYCYLKYINETGGAQDNQYNDCKLFLQECLGFTESYFMLIVDGKYFSIKKMNELRKIQTSNSFLIITTSDEL